MVIALKVRGLTKEFNRQPILRDVSFDVHKGDIFGIIGMSGSGKTTILNHLIGFIEGDEGDIWYRPSYALNDEQEQLKNLQENLYEVKQTFGFAPQKPSFYPRLTVEENLWHFGNLYHLDKEDLQQNMNRLLELTKLESHKKKLARNLSGGMKRRLSIICGLVHKPDILILDEPTADLDPVLREETWNLITKINEMGTTVVVASHFLEEIERWCNRIAIIEEGQILSCGSLGQLREAFSHRTVEITIKTNPKYFSNIIGEINRANIESIVDEDRSITLHTTNPKETLYELARLIRNKSISADALEVHPPTLREVFKKIALQKKRREEQKVEEERTNKKEDRHEQKGNRS